MGRIQEISEKLESSFINEIKMEAKNSNFGIVVVEAESDVTLFSDIFLKEIVKRSPEKLTLTIPRKIRPSLNNKQIVINAVTRALAINHPKRNLLIGIVDADFKNLPNRKKMKKNPHLFKTEEHDIDTHIFLSDAFERFYNNKFRNITSQPPNPNEIRDVCINYAKEVGFFRLAIEDLRDQDQLSRKDWIKIKRDFNNKAFSSWDISLERFLQNLEDYFTSQIQNRQVGARILQIRENHREEGLDERQVVNGHDLIYFFSCLICDNYRNLRTFYREICPNIQDGDSTLRKFSKQIEDDLRLAYKFEYFRGTPLHHKIDLYEKRVGMDFLRS